MVLYVNPSFFARLVLEANVESNKDRVEKPVSYVLLFIGASKDDILLVSTGFHDPCIHKDGCVQVSIEDWEEISPEELANCPMFFRNLISDSERRMTGFTLKYFRKM